MSKDYQFVENRPVARFFYQGDHTHPVRRTVLIIETTDRVITGYELREGSTIREFKDAPVKSYSRKKIAKVGQLDSRRVLKRTAKQNQLNRTTLVRSDLKELIRRGA
ncbi:MAG: hypothetical protein DWQ19_12395 [Crenarchaeota archaeon]|nr:MAG: hypothetical protein DWQ19_12395 [Thermoproteota archaeon]